MLQVGSGTLHDVCTQFRLNWLGHYQQLWRWLGCFNHVCYIPQLLLAKLLPINPSNLQHHHHPHLQNSSNSFPAGQQPAVVA